MPDAGRREKEEEKKLFVSKSPGMCLALMLILFESLEIFLVREWNGRTKFPRHRWKKHMYTLLMSRMHWVCGAVRYFIHLLEFFVSFKTAFFCVILNQPSDGLSFHLIRAVCPEWTVIYFSRSTWPNFVSFDMILFGIGFIECEHKYIASIVYWIIRGRVIENAADDRSFMHVFALILCVVSWI